MQLTYPYSFMAIWMHEKCPAAKLNDARGTGLEFNVIFRLRRDVRALVEGEVYAPHLMMQGFATKTIEPQEELLVNYGEEWWKEAPVIASGKTEDEDKDEECEESEEDLVPREVEEQKASRGEPIRPENYVHCTEESLERAIKKMKKLGKLKRSAAKDHIAHLKQCMKYDALIAKWKDGNGQEQETDSDGTDSDDSDSESRQEEPSPPRKHSVSKRKKKASSQKKKTRKVMSDEDE